MVRLLINKTAVEYQKTFGVLTSSHPGAPLFTMYALVNPANIIMMAAIATHKANLWG
jgi:hypothetical protein